MDVFTFVFVLLFLEDFYRSLMFFIVRRLEEDTLRSTNE